MRSSIVKFIVFLLFTSVFSMLGAQSFVWTTTSDGVFRDGKPFFLNGQSWAKKTGISYDQGADAESQVKKTLTYLNTIGVNTIRIYSSPDESNWDGSSNFDNLIKWIEEWNVANPDNGDPNKAMYYVIQLSPKDPQSSLSGDLPENTTASFDRAISDASNESSVKSMVSAVDGITGGSKYLLAYLIYHELNISSKYSEWMTSVGASGIESFMNKVADAIHTNYASGKLVAHTGDSKDISNGIYKAVEALDNVSGNVFSNFDMLGFNLYISSDGLLSEDQYYRRIVNRRALSVNDNRGWFIGETGASYDSEANPSSVAAANYTNTQGGANLQLMYEKTRALGNMIGFMLFTVQDNDLGEDIGNAMKQRGFLDVYASRKFLYYIYSDVVNELSSNDRFHSTDEHSIGVSIVEETDSFHIRFEFKNKSDEPKQFLYTVHSDAGSGKQRFSVEKTKVYLTLEAGAETIVEVSCLNKNSNNLLAVTSNVIKIEEPFGAYLWGREHILSDAISTIAGLNINTGNLPSSLFQDNKDADLSSEANCIRGKFMFNVPTSIDIPQGQWTMRVHNLNGTLVFRSLLDNTQIVKLNDLVANDLSGVGIYSLVKR